MTNSRNRQVLLARRPYGAPTADEFTLVDAVMPVPRDGQLLRNVYLSIDPYLFGRMTDSKGPYADAFALGELMVEHGLSEFIEPCPNAYLPGEFVAAPDVWQDYAGAHDEACANIRPIGTVLRARRLGIMGFTPGTAAEIAEPASCDASHLFKVVPSGVHALQLLLIS
jgi:NADPH-dependent curcumin reductase